MLFGAWILLFLFIGNCSTFFSSFFDDKGKWLGSRQIRCNWATKGASSGDDKQSSDSRSVVELTTGTSGISSRNVYVYICFYHSSRDF